jgi:uncharacterized protein (DUF2141 family)
VLTFSHLLCAQSRLVVELTNLRNNKGNIAIELLDENKQSVKGATGKIENNKCTVIFNDLKDGKYAIQYFHDENSNKKLDKNFIGIPKEGYGFSNDAIGTFGPKDFEEWLFEVSQDKVIKIKTLYF